MSADQSLRAMTDERLLAGLVKADQELALLDGLEEMDPAEDFDGPFPATKSFETWNANFFEQRRRLLNLGRQMVTDEIARRRGEVA